MKKHFLAVCLFAPVVALLGWLCWLTYQAHTGTEVKVRIQGYDPRDLLSGHYIQYEIDWEQTDCAQFERGICPKNAFCTQARWGRQCRFYIPEKNARELDRLFLQRNDTDMIFEVVYSYQKNYEPIAKQLLINGQDWRRLVD